SSLAEGGAKTRHPRHDWSRAHGPHRLRAQNTSFRIRDASPMIALHQVRFNLPALLMVVAAVFLTNAARAASDVGSDSGLQVPRFVSLKPDRVNVRGGPTKDHDVTWVYQRSGLPVEITAEFENWRRIRDWEGSEGWVYHSLLS